MKNEKHSMPAPCTIASADILEEFRVGDNWHWIIKTQTDAISDTERSKNNVLCRFDLNSQQCSIIQVANESTEEIRSLTELLTTREQQIAALVAMGCANKRVARLLNISEWTVATYLRRIYMKLGVETLAAMASRCASLVRRDGCGHPVQVDPHLLESGLCATSARLRPRRARGGPSLIRKHSAT